MSRSLEQSVSAYLAQCVRDNGCLVRPGMDRYGEIRGDGKRMTAHRAVFLVAGNALEPGEVVRHKCDRPACVDIDHLESGTHAQNVRDIYERNRHHSAWRRGEAHRDAVLNAELVAELREAAREGRSLRSLAGIYGLSYSSVRNAVRGVTWAHVTDPAPLPNLRRNRVRVSRSLAATRADDCAKAAELAQAGASLAEIAVALGVSRHAAFKMTHAAQEVAS